MSKPTIVLVHGAWADASSWNAVAAELHSQDFTVLSPPNLLRGVETDAAYISSFVAQRTTGPVVLVGHSYGGFVITNAALGGGAQGSTGADRAAKADPKARTAGLFFDGRRPTSRLCVDALRRNPIPTCSGSRSPRWSSPFMLTTRRRATTARRVKSTG